VVLLGKVFMELEEITVEESSMYPFFLNITKKVSCMEVRMFKAGEKSWFFTLGGNCSSVCYMSLFSKSLLTESKYSGWLEFKPTNNIVFSFA